MKKTRYKIIYDLNQDIWNWYNAVNNSYPIRQLNDDYKQIAEKILGLAEQNDAEPILVPFLQSKLDDKNSQLNEFIKISKSEFADKFDAACEILEKITGHPMAVKEFTFYVTTFPRMTVFFEEGIIFMYAKIDNELWGMPIDGFLHEGLHFQFDKYWREDDNSPVSKLTDDDYFMLKESLTVILDEDLKPVITLPDCSYGEFGDYRKLLHDHWKMNHDFNILVDFGLKELPKFTNKTN